MQPITVLSLCDGISCAMLALERANIPIKKYYAAEIKKIAIEVSKFNYPNIIHIGDVNNITYQNNILYTQIGQFKEKFDLVIFGSPCQTFSIQMPTDKRNGLNNKQKSGLFLKCNQILQSIKPKWFLVENVASMSKENKDKISSLLGTEPILINSQIIAPALRKRYYWTNIPYTPIKRKDIFLQDILQNGYTNRKKALCLKARDGKSYSYNPSSMLKRYIKSFSTIIFKSKEHYEQCMKEFSNSNGNQKIYEGVRYLTRNEMEQCQTVPIGYTKCLKSYNDVSNVLGDGFTIDIVAHLLSGIK